MKNKSFTLIELLVVIVIIGILAGVIIVSVNSSIGRANIAKGQAFSSTTKEKLFSNLLSEWSFNNLSQGEGVVLPEDTIIEDEWGNYDGLTKGTLTVRGGSACMKGKCLEFDGSTGYILIPIFNIGNSATVSFWAKSSSYSGRMPFSFNGDNYTYGPDLYFSGDLINWNTGNGIGNSFSNSSYPNNNWHYFVVVNNEGGGAELYIDGTKIGTALYKSVKTTANTFFIGKFDGAGYYFRGLIDEFIIYDFPLTSREIKNNYNLNPVAKNYF